MEGGGGGWGNLRPAFAPAEWRPGHQSVHRLKDGEMPTPLLIYRFRKWVSLGMTKNKKNDAARGNRTVRPPDLPTHKPPSAEARHIFQTCVTVPEHQPTAS